MYLFSRVVTSFCICLMAFSLNACSSDDRGNGGENEAHEISFLECGDGQDNDGDRSVDCADPDCAIWIACGGTRDNDAGTPTFDSMVNNNDSTIQSDIPILECAGISAKAEASLAPVDIIWVVDSSGSMSQENQLVQDNMNAFAQSIVTTGVDYRVILIGSSSYITVSDPLGSDANRFLHIDETVGSKNAFEVVSSSFSQYASFLRTNSIVHVVIVTDDNSQKKWNWFQSKMVPKLGRNFYFHAVASPPPPAGVECSVFDFDPDPRCKCEGANGKAAAAGIEYYDLARVTSGTTFSICESDWSPLFTSVLKTSLVNSAVLPCVYQLPEPQEGEALDPTQVNVVFKSSNGQEIPFPKTSNSSQCGNGRAWYYDDAQQPTRIELCPSACTLAQSDENAELKIVLGCQTLLL